MWSQSPKSLPPSEPGEGGGSEHAPVCPVASLEVVFNFVIVEHGLVVLLSEWVGLALLGM